MPIYRVFGTNSGDSDLFLDPSWMGPYPDPLKWGLPRARVRARVSARAGARAKDCLLLDKYVFNIWPKRAHIPG